MAYLFVGKTTHLPTTSWWMSNLEEGIRMDPRVSPFPKLQLCVGGGFPSSLGFQTWVAAARDDALDRGAVNVRGDLRDTTYHHHGAII